MFCLKMCSHLFARLNCIFSCEFDSVFVGLMVCMVDTGHW